jgi:hypothetical protein
MMPQLLTLLTTTMWPRINLDQQTSLRRKQRLPLCLFNRIIRSGEPEKMSNMPVAQASTADHISTSANKTEDTVGSC